MTHSVELKHRTIDQHSSHGSHGGEFIRVITSPEEASAEYKEKLDWSSEFLVQLGSSTPTPGYEIRVQSIKQTGDEIDVKAALLSLGGMQLMVIAFKSIAVAVQRDKQLPVPKFAKVDFGRRSAVVDVNNII